jgi:peptide/nickel transport system substrate-binding protein
MDQMVVTFRMRPDVTWSDGTPLAAQDSVYAFTLASDVATPGSTYLIDRTQVYEAADAQTIQWWGMPGFIDPTYFTNFWAPAPKHLWEQFSPADLLVTDLSTRTPVGWGPYVIQEWLPADHIRLTKNPNYFRQADGFPKFDVLTFRFIADPDAAISELAAGRCDVLDPTVRLDGQAGLLQQMDASGELQASFAPGMTIEWLGLGLVPAVYDDGYDPQFARDRADIFSDLRTRQAIAFCLDRQKVVDTVLFGLTGVPNTYLPPEHSLYNNATTPYPFDPDTGMQLLEEAGWKDTDGNPDTPRVATAVRGVGAGTPLLLNYYTTTATQRRQVVDILSQSLAQCGIGLNAQYFAQETLYAPGPDGVLFGRRFDLIEYAMGVNGIEPPCTWFTGAEIPNTANHWVGTNITGYQSDAYDAACRAARLALPDEQAYGESYRQTQALFSADLPAIPLYFRLRTAAARSDFCHFDLDPSAAALWNLEAFDFGPACQN